MFTHYFIGQNTSTSKGRNVFCERVVLLGIFLINLFYIFLDLSKNIFDLLHFIPYKNNSDFSKSQ